MDNFFNSEDEYIYINKLDMDYCKKMIKQAIERIFSDDYDYDLEEQLKRLVRMRTHLWGLRDLFFFFDADHIIDMDKPILDAIEIVKKNMKEQEEED